MNKDLTVGSPDKVLLKFVLPLFGSMIFQQLYNIADSLIAGKFLGENALAAVGNSYEITLIYIAFGFGCNMGCSVISSRYFGAKDYKNLKTSVFTSFIYTASICVLLMLIGLLGSSLLLNLINTPSEIFADSKSYLDIYTLGIPFIFFYNVSTGIFSALGDSKTPFYFLAVSSLSNIFVDILFVSTFNLGINGLALATLLCQTVSCILALVTILLRLKKIKVEEKVSYFNSNILKEILKVAIPTTLQQSFVSIGNIIIQGIINGFGTAVMAGYSASVKLNNLVITSFNTLGNGISNFTAQNIGAKKYERVKDGYKAGLKIIYIITVPIIILYFFGGNMLINLFLDNPSDTAINTGVTFLKILSPFYFFLATKLVADGILKGAEIMDKFMIATFTDLVLRVLFAYILSMTSLGSNGIWLAWPIGWIIATFMSVYYYKSYINKKAITQ